MKIADLKDTIPMRKPTQRFFTVETKAGGRRASAIIPPRVVAQPFPPRPRLDLSAPALASAPAEKRRILPSLIMQEVPQVELEAQRIAEQQLVRRPRGRPRKAPQIPPATTPSQKTSPVASVQPSAVQAAPQPVQSLRKRKSYTAIELPRGERWKMRRLGRWSR